MNSRDESNIRVGVCGVVRVLLHVIVEEVIQCDRPSRFVFSSDTEDNFCRRVSLQTQIEQKLG